jgi:hypothetical protein
MYLNNIFRCRFDEIVHWPQDVSRGDIVHSPLDQQGIPATDVNLMRNCAYSRFEKPGKLGGIKRSTHNYNLERRDHMSCS